MSRYSEHLAPDYSKAEFVPRKRHNVMLYVVSGYIAAFLVFFALAGGTMYVPASTLFLGFLALMLPTAYVLYHIKRNLDLVTGVEFQNALFSASLSKQNDFFFFADADGNVDFAHHKLEDFLPQLDWNNAYESLGDIANFSASDSLKFREAVATDASLHLTATLLDEAGKRQPMRIALEPVSRPKGYSIVQARLFVQPRSEPSPLPVELSGASLAAAVSSNSAPEASGLSSNRLQEGLPKPSAAPLPTIQQMIDALPMGLYCASPSGHLRAVNTVFEEWLGYAPGEILQRELRIDDLIYTPDNEAPILLGMETVNRRIAFKQKNASLLHVHLQQYSSVRDGGYIDLVVGMVKKEG